jgi:hypothetical protein
MRNKQAFRSVTALLKRVGAAAEHLSLAAVTGWEEYQDNESVTPEMEAHI